MACSRCCSVSWLKPGATAIAGGTCGGGGVAAADEAPPPAGAPQGKVGRSAEAMKASIMEALSSVHRFMGRRAAQQEEGEVDKEGRGGQEGGENGGWRTVGERRGVKRKKWFRTRNPWD